MSVCRFRALLFVRETTLEGFNASLHIHIIMLYFPFLGPNPQFTKRGIISINSISSGIAQFRQEGGGLSYEDVEKLRVCIGFCCLPVSRGFSSSVCWFLKAQEHSHSGRVPCDIFQCGVLCRVKTRVILCTSSFSLSCCSMRQVFLCVRETGVSMIT